MHCLAAVRGHVNSLAVVIAKCKNLDINKNNCLRKEKRSTRDSSYLISGISSLKSIDTVAINSVGDRILQSIIVQGKNENL